MARLLAVLVVLLRALRPLPSSASGNGECGRPHLPPSSLSIGSLRTPFSLIGRRRPRLSRFHWLALRAAREHPENGRRGSPNDGVPHRGVPPMTGFLSARPAPQVPWFGAPPRSSTVRFCATPKPTATPWSGSATVIPTAMMNGTNWTAEGSGAQPCPPPAIRVRPGLYGGAGLGLRDGLGAPPLNTCGAGSDGAVRRGTGFTVQPGGSSV